MLIVTKTLVEPPNSTTLVVHYQHSFATSSTARKGSNACSDLSRRDSDLGADALQRVSPSSSQGDHSTGVRQELGVDSHGNVQYNQSHPQ